MSDRDRLAADLHAELDDLLCRVWESDDVPPHHDMPPAYWLWQADRLIALGWTRLDEERLARALLVADGEMSAWYDLFPLDLTNSARERFLAAIAKAYREDADA